MVDGRRNSVGKRKYYTDVKPSSKWFFLNGELVKVIRTSRGDNMVWLWNPGKEKEQVALLSEFNKNRKRAYSITSTAILLDRDSQRMRKLVKSGFLPKPTGASKGNKLGFRILAFYSEDDIYEIRAALATIHRGRPRTDGLTTASVISEEELRVRLGDGIMLFAKDRDGQLVPIWQETL